MKITNLSAGFIDWRQTKVWKTGFVCRVQTTVADIYRKFLVLSAGLKLRWQTYTGNSWFCLPGSLTGGRHIQEILRFVCRVHYLAADKSQEIKNLSARAACGAGIWQSGGRYGADMGRYCTAVAKDCRYDKSFCLRSENLPERCTKIRPYKEKIRA